jgi:hypothetical protein
MPKKQYPEKEPEIFPPKIPEIIPALDPEEPLIFPEEPDYFPDEDPDETPPFEVPPPGEGP